MPSYPLFLRTKELKDVLGLPESRALALLDSVVKLCLPTKICI